MTAKPSPVGTQVGIQRYYADNQGQLCANPNAPLCKFDDHVAVFNRMRSDLEALANKHRDDKRFRPIWAVRGDFVDELLALAATLEPGAADVETPGEPT